MTDYTQVQRLLDALRDELANLPEAGAYVRLPLAEYDRLRTLRDWVVAMYPLLRETCYPGPCPVRSGLAFELISALATLETIVATTGEDFPITVEGDLGHAGAQAEAIARLLRRK